MNHTRFVHLGPTLALLLCASCQAARSPAQLEEAERIRQLDSLAVAHPCTTRAYRAVSVGRFQTCEIVLDSPQVPGRATPVWYAVEIDVPQRPRFITVNLLASTLQSADGVQTVHKAFDGTDTLVGSMDAAGTLAIGGPCG